MAKSAGVVEINGHRYDSASGAVVGVIDGFVRKRPVSRPLKTISNKRKEPPKKAAARPARSAKASTKIHRRPQHSRTLMRSVVKRPSLRLKEASASAIAKVSRPVAKVLDKTRLEQAKSISKSPRVSRFNSNSSKPALQAKQIIKKVATVRPLAAAPATASLPQTINSHQKLEAMLDKALLSADAHKQSLSRRSNRFLRPFGLPRWASFIVFGLLALAVAVFIAWRSVPAIAVRIASMRAHVTATVPAYTPSGYSFNRVDSNNGNVTIKYAAKGDGKSSYSVSQSTTSWDSQSLQANTLSKKDTVQTSQVDGTTVYIYGTSDNAEWVSNGNLYKISNQAHLSSDQILNIAQSL